ncbi:MAG TPA: urate hydroxylase PuuD [Candidatus Binataceae bacterium]
MDAFLVLLRWLHFLFGITWIGLLYYFNLVQTPFFAETDAAVRSGAVQKLVPRALWWFRWGAMGTVIFGLLYLLIWWSRLGFAFNPWAVAILTGGTLGLIMWANVWFVIWPNQKIVIANALATAGGGQANPAAAPAGRRSGLASRTNTLFSIPMLFFMGAASHYNLFSEASTGGIIGWIVIAGIVTVLVEINALIGSQGPTKKPLDSIGGTIWSGIILWIVLIVIIKGTMGS